MSKTMHWRVVPGVVHIAVHADEAPSDEDWDAYMADVEQHVPRCRRVLVYTRKVGPSAPQRARSLEIFKQIGDCKMSIMTGSRLTQGIVTALSWTFGQNIKAFSTEDFDGAADNLELDLDEKISTRAMLKQLARGAGYEIDAFAGESGRYLRKP